MLLLAPRDRTKARCNPVVARLLENLRETILARAHRLFQREQTFADLVFRTSRFLDALVAASCAEQGANFAFDKTTFPMPLNFHEERILLSIPWSRAGSPLG